MSGEPESFSNLSYLLPAGSLQIPCSDEQMIGEWSAGDVQYDLYLIC